MKTVINAIIYISLLVLLIALPFMCLDCLSNNFRYEKAMVSAVEGDVVVLETADGNLWEMESEHDWLVGEVVKVCFLTQGTETIYDDAIDYVRGV